MNRSEYDNFMANAVWQEISSVLHEVIEGLNEDLTGLDPVKEPGELARKQGRKLMAQFVLDLPEDILQEIESKES